MKQKNIQAGKGKAKKGYSKVRAIGISAVILIIAGAIAGFAIYRERVAPFRHAIVVVDSASIDMGHFLKRLYLSNGDPFEMLQTVTEELLIRQVAPKPPYNIDVTEKDIEEYLKTVARGESETISDDDYREWYRQQRNTSGLSKADFNDMVGTDIMTRRLGEHLAALVPSVADQVHLYMIPVADIATSRIVKERLESGENFSVLAREVSIDTALRENGGEFGWMPRRALIPTLANAAFDELEVGEVSGPIFLDDQNVVIIMVSEKASAREVDRDSLQIIKAGALDEWLRQEQRQHNVEFHGFSNGYDTETDAWVRWQLQRMSR